MTHLPLSTRQIYRWPAVMALIIFAGLLSALFGDGVWDVISWIFLAIPMLVITRYLILKAQ